MLALVSSFLWGVIWLIFPSIAGLCHSALQLIEQLNQKGRTINLEFQIYGSALIEPQILQWSGKMQWTTIPKLGFHWVGTLISENWPDGLLGPTKLQFWGVKMAKKWFFFKFFTELKHIKNTFCKKNGVKTSFQLLAMGEAIYHPLIWGCHRQLDDQHQ